MNLKMGMVIFLLGNSFGLFGMQSIKIPNAQVLKERLQKAGFGTGQKMNSIVDILADQNKDPQDIFRVVAQALEACDDVVKKNRAEEKLLSVLFCDDFALLRTLIEQRNKAEYEFMKGAC